MMNAGDPEDGVTLRNDVIDAFGLRETYMDKKTLMSHLKGNSYIFLWQKSPNHFQATAQISCLSSKETIPTDSSHFMNSSPVILRNCLLMLRIANSILGGVNQSREWSVFSVTARMVKRHTSGFGRMDLKLSTPVYGEGKLDVAFYSELDPKSLVYDLYCTSVCQHVPPHNHPGWAMHQFISTDVCTWAFWLNPTEGYNPVSADANDITLLGKNP